MLGKFVKAWPQNFRESFLIPIHLPIPFSAPKQKAGKASRDVPPYQVAIPYPRPAILPGCSKFGNQPSVSHVRIELLPATETPLVPTPADSRRWPTLAIWLRHGDNGVRSGLVGSDDAGA